MMVRFSYAVACPVCGWSRITRVGSDFPFIEVDVPIKIIRALGRGRGGYVAGVVSCWNDSEALPYAVDFARRSVEAVKMFIRLGILDVREVIRELLPLIGDGLISSVFLGNSFRIKPIRYEWKNEASGGRFGVRELSIERVKGVRFEDGW